MAWITKKRGRWHVRWVATDSAGGKRQRTSDPLPTKKAAQALKPVVEISVARTGDWEPDRARPSPDLEAVLADWIRARAIDLEPRTLRNYAEAGELFKAYLAARDGRRRWTLEDLSTELVVEGFWGWLRDPTTWTAGRDRADGKATQRPRQPGTCNKRVRAVYGAWVWAAEEGEQYRTLAPSPPRKIRLPKTRSRRAVFAPSWNEIDAMVAQVTAAGAEWTRRAVILARYTGRRRQAILHLQWDEIDLEGGRILWAAEHDKIGEAWETPIHPALEQHLRTWVSTGAMVCDAPESELTARGHVDRSVRRAWTRAGVPANRWHGRPLHCMRSTIETELARAGVQQQVIDLYLGQITPGTGPRSYTERVKLWPSMVAALEHIPALELQMPDPTVVPLHQAKR